MSELTVTEDQRRRLEAVCDDLEGAFVGAYGSVTPADALEYLLDTYTPPGDADPEVSAEGRTTRAVDAGGPGSGGERSTPIAVGTTDGTVRNVSESSSAESSGGEPTDGAVDGRDLTAIPGVGEVTAEALTAAGFDSVSAIRAAAPAALTDAEGVGEKQAIDISAAVEDLAAGGATSAAGTGGGDDAERSGPDGDAAPGAVSAERTLQQARSLLDTHDDRWREGSGDEPYEVDLPDGSTTGARTKDDVKRLLFKHWR